MRLQKMLVMAGCLAAVSFAQFCFPTTVNSNCANGDEYLSNIVLGSVTYTQSCPAAGTWYRDFTSTGSTPLGTVAVTPGAVLPVTYTISNYWSSDKVWFFLDGNNNQLFDLPSETIATHTPTSAGTYTVSLPIPAGVQTGVTLRLRVRLTWGTPPANNEACAPVAYSNTFDFDASAGALIPQYQVNTAHASLDFNGTQGGAFVPASTSVCANQVFTVNAGGSAVGFPFDVVMTGAPFISVNSGAIQTAGSQILNVNLNQPFNFVFGGTFTNGFFPFVLPASLPFTADLGFQMAIIDPTLAGSVALSQPARLITAPSTTLLAGPTGDDGMVLVTGGTSPSCMPVVQFYGTTYSQYYVCSNGRVMFQPAGAATPNTGDWSPTPAEALTDTFAGFWIDFQVGAAGTGTVNITVPAPGMLQVDYVNQIYWNNPGLVASGSIAFDSTTGAITLSGMDVWPFFPVTGGTVNQCVLGISPGLLGSALGAATDPGMTGFGQNLSGVPPVAATDMLYAFGQPQGLSGGAASIVFVPNGAGNYNWAGF